MFPNPPGYDAAARAYDNALPPEDDTPNVLPEEDTCEACDGELDTDNPDYNLCTACLAARAESRRESREER